MTILSAILLFGFLIFIHELGHFLFAKLSGVGVLKFSLGFGPKVVGWKVGETEYLLSAVPLGGYVKMVGEDHDDEEVSVDEARSFKNQSVLKRGAIVVAGPAFNLLTAVVIFFIVFMIGIPTLLPVIGEVMPDTPAARAMFQKGDRVEAINGTPVKHWVEMTNLIQASPGKPLMILIKRAEGTVTLSITPEAKRVKDIFGEDRQVGLIGVKPLGETDVIREGPGQAAISAVERTVEISTLTVVGIVKLIQRVIPTDTIGGPVLIFQLAEKSASTGALNFFTFAAVISINLAILNILPIPVLDGGHLLFLGIEAVRKRPLNERAVTIAQRLGIALILFLMAFAMYNDVLRLITGKPLP